MASQLPQEQHAAYSAIIDRILAASDLNSVTVKVIRQGLQDEVEYDLTPQKEPLRALIQERFHRFLDRQQNGEPSGVTEPIPTTNGTAHGPAHGTSDHVKPVVAPAHKRKSPEADSDDSSDVVDSPAPKKKPKPLKGVESDEVVAARLQAQLDAEARPTRGSGTRRKPAPVKRDKKVKRKSAAKVRADDDSDIGSGEGERPEKEKKGGFHKPMHLSAPLAAMLGESTLSRPQTVKKIWEYVKARDLQDPSDKRQLVCDDAMRAVFDRDRVHMFTMNKLLASHLYPVDEVL